MPEVDIPSGGTSFVIVDVIGVRADRSRLELFLYLLTKCAKSQRCWIVRRADLTSGSDFEGITIAVR